MFSKKRNLVPFLLVLFLLIIYIGNLSKSVYGGDVGDLVTASYVAGVPHAPGYPLFTLLGYLLTRVSLGQTPAFMVGLISAISAAVGILFFYLIIFKLTKNIVVALISSFILAFSYLYWFYAEIAEVFALNNFFVFTLFYLAILFRQKKDLRTLFIFSFVLGLSLTNHHTILFIFPSLLILIIPGLFKIFKKNPKKVFFSFFFMILGFSVYLYVPIAASRNPVINWDHVNNFSSFFRLLLRRDYGTFNAGSFDPPNILQKFVIFKTYLFSVVSQLTLPVIFLSAIGWIVLFLKDRVLSFSVLIAFIISGPVFVVYAGFPLFGSFFIGVYERFFILSSLFLLFLFPFGLIFVTEVLGKISKNKFVFLFQAIFFIIPISLFYYNFPKTNLSNLWIGDNLAYDFLSPLPKDSVLLLSGDTLLFNAWYVSWARGFRPDVKIVNFNGLAGDGYFEQVQDKIIKNNPKLKDRELVMATIKQIKNIQPLFSYSDVQLSDKEKLIWVPYGLGYELRNLQDKLSEPEFLERTEGIMQTLHVPKTILQSDLASKNLSVSDIPLFYANAYLSTGNYLLSSYKDNAKALEFYKKALLVDPNYSKTYEILGVYNLTSEKKCDQAEKNFLKSKSLDFKQRFPYFFLYAIYKECLKNEKKTENIIKDFEKNFGVSFYSELNKTIGKNNKKDNN